MVAHLGHGLIVDQRDYLHALLQTIADAQPGELVGQPLDKLFLHRCFHQKAVGTDTGLPAVAKLGANKPLHGLFKVGVGKDNKGGIAAQLK